MYLSPILDMLWFFAIQLYVYLNKKTAKKKDF